MSCSSADEAFLASTTREVQPIAAIDDRVFDAPGPVTRGRRGRRGPVRERLRLRERLADGDSMKILTVIGNRPQFIKAAAVSPRLRAGGHQELLVHTGQHFDDELSTVFFAELGLPAPDLELGVALGSNSSQTARMLGALEPVLGEAAPDAVLVYGDTNSTLAGALAGAQAGVPVAHVEAGMRSFDRAMPEELNRVLTDHASSLLLCSSSVAVENLRREGVGGAVELVGDVMVDVALAIQPRARERVDLVALAGLEPGGYVLATAHRAGNVDDPARLAPLVDLLCAMPLPVLFTIHPRTRRRLDEADLLGRARELRRSSPRRRSATSRSLWCWRL